MVAMAKRASDDFEVACPCCGAVLKVDGSTHTVISHIAKAAPRMFQDFDEATRALKEQDSRRESIFRQSMEAQKNSAELLEKKFQDAVKKAKETPDTPRIRDIDLD